MRVNSQLAGQRAGSQQVGQDYVALLRFPFPSHGLSYAEAKALLPSQKGFFRAPAALMRAGSQRAGQRVNSQGTGQDYVALLRFPFPSHGLSYAKAKSTSCIRRTSFLCTGVPYESKLSTGHRYTKKAPNFVECFCFGVIRTGFEPVTHSLEGCCSIQLSYRTSPFISVLFRKWLQR